MPSYPWTNRSDWFDQLPQSEQERITDFIRKAKEPIMPDLYTPGVPVQVSLIHKQMDTMTAEFDRVARAISMLEERLVEVMGQPNALPDRPNKDQAMVMSPLAHWMDLRIEQTASLADRLEEIVKRLQV